MALMMKFPGFKRKVFTVSYDDGTIHDKRLVETMMKHGIKGTLNVNSSMLGAGGTKLSAEELVELIEKSGNEVAVHGYRHIALGQVDAGSTAYDVMKDREVLESIFGKVIKGMAYAGGSYYNDEVVEVLKSCGIEYARTVISTEKFDMPTDWLRLPATCHHQNPRLMELAREFVEKEEAGYFWRNTPMMFYVWGHSAEFEKNDNWEVFEKLCEYVGGREDIWYATNGEIYRYHTAFKRMKVSADQKIIYNPSAIDIYLRMGNKDVLVPAGQTVKNG